jgi:hypothetical protein
VANKKPEMRADLAKWESRLDGIEAALRQLSNSATEVAVPDPLLPRVDNGTRGQLTVELDVESGTIVIDFDMSSIKGFITMSNDKISVFKATALDGQPAIYGNLVTETTGFTFLDPKQTLAPDVCYTARYIRDDDTALAVSRPFTVNALVMHKQESNCDCTMSLPRGVQKTASSLEVEIHWSFAQASTVNVTKMQTIALYEAGAPLDEPTNCTVGTICAGGGQEQRGAEAGRERRGEERRERGGDFQVCTSHAHLNLLWILLWGGGAHYRFKYLANARVLCTCR